MMKPETKVRLLFMAIGAVFGLSLAAMMHFNYSERIEESEQEHGEQVTYLRDTIQGKERIIEHLSSEYAKIKSQVRIRERVEADGSMEREYDAAHSSETSKEVATKQREIETLQQTLRYKQLLWDAERRRLIERRPRNAVFVGAVSDNEVAVGGKMSVTSHVFFIGWINGGDTPDTVGVGVGLDF